MEWKDAIVKVLSDAGTPIHYTEIAEQIVERGLREELTATPANTVAAIITILLKNEATQSPFFRTARGYTLRSLQQQSPVLAQEELIDTESSETTGVVNAFGMFWDRSKVLWEAQPRILGQQQAGSTEVNFCEEKGVYLLHDSQGVVYVGRVSDQNLGRRLYQHTVDRLTGRLTRFSWFGVYPVEQNGMLKTTVDFSRVDINVVIATMEAVLIEGLEPRQNRKRGDDFQAVEFLQFEDPQLQLARKLAIVQELTAGLKN
jgi:hypothetical protein